MIPPESFKTEAIVLLWLFWSKHPEWVESYCLGETLYQQPEGPEETETDGENVSLAIKPNVTTTESVIHIKNGFMLVI